MEASKKQINDIFNGFRILKIPFFQRSYVWREDEWQRFLDDLVYISTDRKPYFFGSLIFKQEESPTTDEVGDVRTIIDGQQRLTTLIVFFKALSLLNDDHKIFETFEVRESESKVALRHNRNDIKAFEGVTNLERDGHVDDDVKDNKIVAAYNFFRENIEPEKINKAKILTNAVFVVVDLSANDDEQQIFDTLNSLGVRLSTAELLKNFFFRQSDVEFYETHWHEVFEKNDNVKEYWDEEFFTGQNWRTFIDLFFYAYLQIMVQNEDKSGALKDRGEFSRLENLFSSYKKLITDYGYEKKNMLEEIKDHANVFRSHVSNEVVKSGLRGSPSMERINAIIFDLGTTTLIPYILFILKNTKDDERRNNLFHAIESFVMRRLVVRASNRGYNSLFLRMIGERILTVENFYKFVNELAGTVNAMPDDTELKKGFDDSKLVNKTALGILYFIESYNRNDKYAAALRGMSSYTLEHLMPKKWEKHWGQLDEQQTDARNKKLLTLGNLAIITQKLNSSIRDAKWIDKLNGRGEKGGLKVYASGIDIHTDFLDEDEWNEGKITNRAKTLFEKARKIWLLE